MVKIMKHKALICAIIIAIGVIGVTALVYLGSAGRKTNTPAEPTATSEVGINVQNPTATDGTTPVTPGPTEPVTEPTPFDPSDPVGNGDIAPDEIPDKNNPIKIVDENVENGTDTATQPTADAPVVIDENVTSGQKDKTEEKSESIDNEILNDNEIEKREETEKKQQEEAEKDDKPAEIVIEDKTTGSEEDKPVSVIDDTEEKSEDSDGNAPVYVSPVQGGQNPFEGGGDSEIDDHGSDEFIGDGGDRPGEGIHF